MKKSLLFILALGAVFSANAQREYQDGVYTVVGQHGNKVDVRKGHCQEQPPQFFIEDNTQCINGFDDVIENESSVSNVLVIENKVVNYYHVDGEIKERHIYYPSNVRQTYRRTSPRSDVIYSGYEQVQPYANYQSIGDNDKWFFFFQLDSDYLTNREELGHLIYFAKTNPRSTLYIDAYADALTGNEAYNLDISRRRANAIVSVLLNEGISSTRMRVKYHGCVSQPYNTNNLNRCVTVKASRL